MALKVKAQEKLQKIGTHAGSYRYASAMEAPGACGINSNSISKIWKYE